MIFRKHSLLKRVTLWCAGTLAVFSLITAAASFAIGYEEAKDRQDDILKEVVGMLSRDIVQQRQRNKIQELTLGGFYGPGSDKGETLPQYGALTMDDDVFEDHFQLDDDSKDAVVRAGETVLVRQSTIRFASSRSGHSLRLNSRFRPSRSASARHRMANLGSRSMRMTNPFGGARACRASANGWQNSLTACRSWWLPNNNAGA